MAGEWFLVGLAGAWLSVKDLSIKGGIPVSRMTLVSVCVSLCVSISSPLSGSQTVWQHIELKQAWCAPGIGTMFTTPLFPPNFPNKYARRTLLQKRIRKVYLLYFSRISDFGTQNMEMLMVFSNMGTDLSSITHVLKQCAAVTTHMLPIKVPPH